MTQNQGKRNSNLSRHSQMDEEYEQKLLDASLKEPLRLGRRESEPHSAEVTYLFDVLSSNFPQHRTMWDLHHYFVIGGEKVDLQFDISFFLDFSIPEDLPSYKASDFNNRIPDLVINVLSKSTWQKDLSEIQEICRGLKVPIYVLLLSYPIAPKVFPSPFLRVYILNDENIYIPCEINKFMIENQKTTDNEAQIKLPEKYPFNLALEKLERTYYGRKTRSRLILIDKKKKHKILSKAEREKQRADEEKQRADEEKQRADKEKQRADEEKQRADKERERAEKLERDLQDLQRK